MSMLLLFGIVAHKVIGGEISKCLYHRGTHMPVIRFNEVT